VQYEIPNVVCLFERIPKENPPSPAENPETQLGFRESGYITIGRSTAELFQKKLI